VGSLAKLTNGSNTHAAAIATTKRAPPLSCDMPVTSTQNGFVDLVDWLGFLCAKEYLIDLLVRVHSLSPTDANARAKAIIPHARLAMGTSGKA